MDNNRDDVKEIYNSDELIEILVVKQSRRGITPIHDAKVIRFENNSPNCSFACDCLLLTGGGSASCSRYNKFLWTLFKPHTVKRCDECISGFAAMVCKCPECGADICDCTYQKFVKESDCHEQK